MKKWLLLGCWVGVGQLAHGQGQVSGKILDKLTQQPVPYASVSVLGSRAGTTSNAEGEFTLKMSALPGKLAISQLGYGRDTVAVLAAGTLPPVALVPAAVQLPGVELGSYAAGLMQKAYRELQRSYPNKQYGQAFYRQTTRLDNTPVEVQEMMWHVKASSAGPEGTNLAQARYAKKKDALITYKNLSTFTKTFGLYSPQTDTARTGRIFGPDPAKFYTLKLLGVTQSGDQNLAEIAFVGKPEVNPYHVQGAATIDIDTHQVLRFRVSTDAGGKSNNPLLQSKEGQLTYGATFRPAPTGAVLDHLITTYSLLLGRLLKPDVRMQATAFTYFYEWQPTPAGVAYAAANAQASDLVTIKQVAYDPAFWRDNPVVKRTPLEEEIITSFEQSKSFGTLLAR